MSVRSCSVRDPGRREVQRASFVGVVGEVFSGCGTQQQNTFEDLMPTTGARPTSSSLEQHRVAPSLSYTSHPHPARATLPCCHCLSFHRHLPPPLQPHLLPPQTPPAMQVPNTRYKPPTLIADERSAAEPLLKHARHMARRYGAVTAVSLVNQGGSEGRLGASFKRLVSDLPGEVPFQIVEFDFHHECGASSYECGPSV
jgi:hypothetical protein